MSTQAIVVDTTSSAHSVLRAVALDKVRLSEGYWAERYSCNHTTSVRELWELLADPAAGHVLTNLRIAAGIEQGEFAGTDWQDAWLYKWIEAAACVFRTTGDEWLRERMDEAIELIGQAQAPDGYVASQTQARGIPRFDDPRKHEVYTMGHLLTAGVIHRRMTGSDSLYSIVVRVADFLCSVLGTSVKPAYAHNPSAIMGLIELYRESGEKRYLECAKLIVDSRGTEPSLRGRDLWHRPDGILGTDQIQDRTPLRDAKEVVGHNVFFTYLFAGAADVQLESTDADVSAALDRMWDDLVNQKMTVNGGVSPMGHGLSVNGDIVVEAVGKPFFLPHEDSYNETCGQVGNLMWNYRMLCAKPHGRYADMMEHEIYNGITSGVDLAGENYWYRNQLRRRTDHELTGHNAFPERVKPGKNRICCPTNVVRTIAQWPGYLFSTDTEGVWIHHYASCTADLESVKLSAVTDYPWDGTVAITVDAAPASALRLVFRIPGWVTEAAVTVNGTAVTTDEAAPGYRAVTRVWKPGDRLELDFPMPVRLVEAHPRAENCRNQVAVMRGPILYCLESADLPAGVELDDVLIPSDINLEPVPVDMPYGIVALGGTASGRQSPAWRNRLYRDMSAGALDPVAVRLVPYFAWSNRGYGSMSVWLPVVWR